MINIIDVHKIELEITSDCNAACPGCARTLNRDILEVTSFSLDDLKRILPDEAHLKNKDIRLCGVLGDPAIHPQFVEIVEYLLEGGAYVTISTNGGVAPRSSWYRLGELSKEYGRDLIMMFCIDGHRETNHIYRVNTKFDVVQRNIEAFAENSYKGEDTRSKWVFIVFDHNEHEIEVAKAHAKKLGLKFVIRTGMRNSLNEWTAQIAKKEGRGKVTKEVKTITTTGSKEHARKDEVLELMNKIQTNQVDEEVVKSIVCKYVHEGEIFINAKQEMWPCCFLWDSAFKNKENFLEKLSEYPTEWNSLKTHSIEEVMKHPWYTKVLEESWNPSHNKHMKRCVASCGFNKAYQNVMVEQE